MSALGVAAFDLLRGAVVFVGVGFVLLGLWALAVLIFDQLGRWQRRRQVRRALAHIDRDRERFTEAMRGRS